MARKDEMTNYFLERHTSGFVEGLNNKIKVLKRTAYGYRDIDFFGLRILFLHQTKFNLTGV